MTDKRKDYIHYFGNENPLCPYCDHINIGVGTDNIYDGSEHKITCDSCEKEFSCEVIMSPTFTTHGECSVHKLYQNYSFSSGMTCQGCAQEYFAHDIEEGGRYQKLNADQYEIIPRET